MVDNRISVIVPLEYLQNRGGEIKKNFNLSALVVVVLILLAFHSLPYLKYSSGFVAIKILPIIAEGNRVIGYKLTPIMYSLSAYPCNDGRSFKIHL